VSDRQCAMFRKLSLVLGLAAFAPGLFAGTVYWTDWTSSDAINVTYTGGYFGAQTPNGTDFWQPNVYTSALVGNAPDSLNNGIIEIGTGSGGSFTFSSPIQDPIMGVVSLNGPTLTFDAAFNVQNSGCGYWGCGTLFYNAGNTLSSNGEGHGSIEFPGAFSSISFTESGVEDWRGLTVGVVGSAAPEPATWMIIGAGIVLLGWRRKSA
jgi:hypothetical protein